MGLTSADRAGKGSDSIVLALRWQGGGSRQHAERAAIDADVLAVNCIGARACEKRDEIGDFLAAHDATNRNVGGDARLDLGPRFAPTVAATLLEITRFHFGGVDESRARPG